MTAIVTYVSPCVRCAAPIWVLQGELGKRHTCAMCLARPPGREGCAFPDECSREPGHEGPCGSDECDGCNGQGTYWLDGVPTPCEICAIEGDS